ncbi:hypothetical protein TWF506_002673 [Arthrobotrys conoides]|uniref:Uncharacterized protein n=1 Tax=Arthrobotrys conoides TaxID=74498 RepID=A0AAN8NDE4_9PEZI
MAIPRSCTVLIVGGGPAGSYAAAALAREGIDTVLLEADKFPRYHVGESVVPSLRYFFKFIEFDEIFSSYGFFRKNGGVIKIAQSQPDAYSDFLAELGPNEYAWNIIRSESDDLMFRYAGTCGAHIFDETKVEDIHFEPYSNETAPGSTENNSGLPYSNKPVSASWVRKVDGTSGSITFKYLIDASGKRGLLSTKYLKNRKVNENLKNVASWGYWKTDKVYGPGTIMEGAPYFEALEDCSGWAWYIPLHDGTRSIGLVQDQKMMAEKKKSLGRPSTLDFFNECMKMAPNTKDLLKDAELVSDIKSASDWSYTASTYHIPNARICGDAGSFIDPLFSSGVHLAIASGLSAAATICASIRGDCDEATAGSWHSKKTVESYTRYFLIVSSTTKQMRQQQDPVIRGMNEGFEKALGLFNPVVQGTADADAKNKFSKADMSKTLEFCFRAIIDVPSEKRNNDAVQGNLECLRKHLTPDKVEILETLRSRRMIRDDHFELDNYTLDTIDGYAPNLVRGKLGLIKAEQANIENPRILAAK